MKKKKISRLPRMISRERNIWIKQTQLSKISSLKFKENLILSNLENTRSKQTLSWKRKDFRRLSNTTTTAWESPEKPPPLTMWPSTWTKSLACCRWRSSTTWWWNATTLSDWSRITKTEWMASIQPTTWRECRTWNCDLLWERAMLWPSWTKWPTLLLHTSKPWKSIRATPLCKRIWRFSKKRCEQMCNL